MPSNSFSHASFSESDIGFPSGRVRGGGAISAPKSESCGATAVASRWKASRVSIFSRRVPRLCSAGLIESSAPHLMSDSSDFRFRFLEPTRERNSEREANGPFAFRSEIIASEIPSPKFLIDDNPNLIASLFSPTTVKTEPLSFTSGGRTGIPMRFASATKTAIDSVSPESAVRTAVRYSTG